MDYVSSLVIVVFLVAIWNTSVGPTGGISFAAMAVILPPIAVVPIHAIVEAVSGLSRAVALRKFVNWKFVAPFVLGGVLGCFVGVPILDMEVIGENILQILLGLTMLIVTWIPFQRLIVSKSGAMGMFSGFGTTFLTLFIGATGALVSALIHQRCEDQRQVVGTWSMCMLFQHGTKILIFGLLGFSFLLYWKLLIALMISTIAGTWIGQKILFKIPQNITKPIFKAVVTLLGFYVLGQGLGVNFPETSSSTASAQENVKGSGKDQGRHAWRSGFGPGSRAAATGLDFPITENWQPTDHWAIPFEGGH